MSESDRPGPIDRVYFIPSRYRATGNTGRGSSGKCLYGWRSNESTHSLSAGRSSMETPSDLNLATSASKHSWGGASGIVFVCRIVRLRVGISTQCHSGAEACSGTAFRKCLAYLPDCLPGGRASFVSRSPLAPAVMANSASKHTSFALSPPVA
eukprot:582676-Pyramimonas_sp.AAC.1